VAVKDGQGRAEGEHELEVKELLRSPKNAFSMNEEGTGGDGEHNTMFLGGAQEDAWEWRSKLYTDFGDLG
jgi:hypothetical protein